MTYKPTNQLTQFKFGTKLPTKHIVHQLCPVSMLQLLFLLLVHISLSFPFTHCVTVYYELSTLCTRSLVLYGCCRRFMVKQVEHPVRDYIQLHSTLNMGEVLLECDGHICCIFGIILYFLFIIMFTTQLLAGPIMF